LFKILKHKESLLFNYIVLSEYQTYNCPLTQLYSQELKSLNQDHNSKQLAPIRITYSKDNRNTNYYNEHYETNIITTDENIETHLKLIYNVTTETTFKFYFLENYINNLLKIMLNDSFYRITYFIFVENLRKNYLMDIINWNINSITKKFINLNQYKYDYLSNIFNKFINKHKFKIKSFKIKKISQYLQNKFWK